MPAKRGHSKKRLPSKGTKRREMLRLMLRPEGLTANEAIEFGLGGPGVVSDASERLYADYGFDVRSFRIPNPNHNPRQRGSKKLLAVYRVVGRFKDCGGYRSFTHKPYCVR